MRLRAVLRYLLNAPFPFSNKSDVLAQFQQEGVGHRLPVS